MNRGIVTAPAIVERYNNGFKQKRNLSIEEIRYFIMYFNKVVIPTNNLIHFGIQNEKELIELNLIERPRKLAIGRFDSSKILDFQINSQLEVLDELRKVDNDTIWNLHQIEGDLINVKDSSLEKKINIQMKFLNTLPVPVEKISFEEILKFKEKRKDELNNLHELIDKLYIEILSSPDKYLTEQKTFNELKTNIKDITNISKEEWDYFKYFHFNPEISIQGFYEGITEGYQNGGLFGALGGGITSTLDIKVTKNKHLKKSELSYISKASTEGIVKPD